MDDYFRCCSVIAALRQKAARIQLETMQSIENKMPDLTEREKKVLNKHTKSIINQLLKEPILQAKEMASSQNPKEQLALFQQIFGIEEEVEEEARKQQLHQKERMQKQALETQITDAKLSY